MDSIELFRNINAAAAVIPPLVWMTLSLLGTGWAAFALVFPSILFAPRIFYAVVIATPLAGLTSRLIKITADAPRPPAVLEPDSFILLGDALKSNSMPSGHTITAFTVVAAIHFASKKTHPARSLTLFALALGVGLSRIAIGVHWVEDVAVGAAIGVVAGYLGALLAKRLPDGVLQVRSWWLRGLSLWGLLCIGVLLTRKLDFVANKPAQTALAALTTVILVMFWVRSWRDARRP